MGNAQLGALFRVIPDRTIKRYGIVAIASNSRQEGTSPSRRSNYLLPSARFPCLYNWRLFSHTACLARMNYRPISTGLYAIEQKSDTAKASVRAGPLTMSMGVWR